MITARKEKQNCMESRPMAAKLQLKLKERKWETTFCVS
ncbi:hypothetical protein Cabys_2810 [Caldithrix abyssi DSM 13497]|uniref:Uncharacterized protein n=1 Tax=Caldithrix abyssi DSM 13497 TaxID=880073 RepID=A0A1J1CAK1_CALAY|nr:hypothetical protein Cabys_2810 [Caldithrix abyssi DSM 13497]